ncbi:hypothetical protein ES703_99265 [subsurface metagenome]
MILPAVGLDHVWRESLRFQLPFNESLEDIHKVIFPACAVELQMGRCQGGKQQDALLDAVHFPVTDDQSLLLIQHESRQAAVRPGIESMNQCCGWEINTVAARYRTRQPFQRRLGYRCEPGQRTLALPFHCHLQAQ